MLGGMLVEPLQYLMGKCMSSQEIQGLNTYEEQRICENDIISSYKKIMSWCDGVLLRHLDETSRCVYLQILCIH